MEEDRNVETSKYGIINYELLEYLAIKQAPKGEAGRLFRQDGVKLDQVKELRIEFLNVISLEHLWPMKNITKLILSHNCIEKIEKLDDLIKLRELDLAFNRIKIMEGLNHLINLEILILSGNDIEQVGAIEDLQKLTILSLANNKIKNWNHVMYLRQFKELRSLNMQGNPCMQQKGFMDHVIAFIPQLVYFSYRMIDEEQKNKSREIHRLAITKTEESELKRQRSLNKMKALEEKDARDYAAFVENLDEGELVKLLFERDRGNTVWKGINIITGSVHEIYEIKINETSRQVYDFGNRKAADRENEISMFQKTIAHERNLVRSTARRLMNDIDEHRNQILEEVKKKFSEDTSEKEPKISDQDDSTLDIGEAHKIAGDFNVFLSKKWTKLMYNEVVLHEQMEDVLESFKKATSNFVQEFVEFVEDKFGTMRTAEETYHEEIERIVNSYKGNMNSEEVDISEDVKELFENLPVLDCYLAASHTFRLELIDNRSSLMVQRVQQWAHDLIHHIETSENTRHRSQILEISHFLQFQRESLEEIFQILNLPMDKHLEADVAAALDE